MRRERGAVVQGAGGEQRIKSPWIAGTSCAAASELSIFLTQPDAEYLKRPHKPLIFRITHWLGMVFAFYLSKRSYGEARQVSTSLLCVAIHDARSDAELRP